MDTTRPTSEPHRTTVPPVAGAKVPWLRRPFESLWQRRQLYRRVQVRDIEASFRGSALGLLWIVLIPLALVAIYTFVFGMVMQSAWATAETRPLEVPLIYFCGILIFAFFFEVLNRSPMLIRNHASYVKKVIFPLDLLGWMVVGTAATKMAIGFTLLFGFIIVFQGGPTASMLLIPVLLLPFLVLMVGIAWFFAAIGTYIRDLGHVIAAVSPVIMFVSPVFYSLQQVPEDFRGAYLANPLTFILENARQVLFFGTGIPWEQYAVYWAAAVVVFFAGYGFFQRARPGFADVV